MFWRPRQRACCHRHCKSACGMQPTQRSAQKIREEVLRKLCHNVPFLLRLAKNGWFLWMVFMIWVVDLSLVYHLFWAWIWFKINISKNTVLLDVRRPPSHQKSPTRTHCLKRRKKCTKIWSHLQLYLHFKAWNSFQSSVSKPKVHDFFSWAGGSITR